MSIADKLQDYANSLESGHLKGWKARSIVGTLIQIPDIGYDTIRLLNFLTNSLEMEGFNPQSIQDIHRWVVEEVL